MKLKEFEAKKLLKEVGVSISEGILITEVDEIPEFQGERVLKVQTLSGGRGKAGGIKIIGNSEEAKEAASLFLGKNFLNEEISEILLGQKIDIKQELYLGIMFDPSKRGPLLIFSSEGGVDIEEVKKKSPDKIVVKEINYLDGINLEILEEVPLYLHETIAKLYTCFIKFDCKMIEINPLVLTPNDELIAVDAVAVLDDDAKFRREVNFPERTDNRKATAREIAARQIDQDDHRGVAGKTFVDLDGDIAILTSGGGATMTLMESLIEFGGKAANFTEYSGNPPLEKVEKLTRVVLDKENLSGLLVAGVIANFTNIAETIQGIVNILKEKKPDFPIVVRRAGPFDREAKELLMKAKEEQGLDIHYFDENTPLTKAAEIMVDLSNKYKTSKEKIRAGTK